jgi:hypothetical protein
VEHWAGFFRVSACLVQARTVKTGLPRSEDQRQRVLLITDTGMKLTFSRAKAEGRLLLIARAAGLDGQP